MSPLARVAVLAAVTTGTAVALSAPASAQPTPESPSTPVPSFSEESPLSPSESSTASPSLTESPSASASASASGQDAQYLQQAHQTNLAEIAAGKLAQQKGHSQTVKNLGAKFVTDHTKLDQELKPVAQTLGVGLPNAPNAQQQAVAAQLNKVSGTPFDRLFVTTQLAGHMQAMQAGQREIDTGHAPQAVKVARDSAPVIASHHQALDSAARSLGIPLSATPPATASPTLPVSPQRSVHS